MNAAEAARLPVVELGATGLRVARIGLGLAALGRPGYINLRHAADVGGDLDVAAMEARAHAVLDAAWAGGVDYFDVARSYGRAEEFLASWLVKRGIPPHQAVVGSKWGYTYTAGWKVEARAHEVKEHSLATFERQLAETGGALGMHLDVYQIHSATLESGVLDDVAVLKALAALRERGVAVGLSTSGPRQAEVVRRALAVEVDGVRLFETVQVTWNLLERSAGPVLAEAHAAGVGVIVKEALANGRLTARNDDPAFSERRARLERVAGEAGAGIDALGLAAALAQPWAHVVLSGAATPEQLHSNLRAANLEWSDEITTELAPLAEDAVDYWSARGKLRWN